MALKKRTPATVGNLQQMLGFLSYYHSFISNFVYKAKPLYNLLGRGLGQHDPGLPSEDENKLKKTKNGRLLSRTPVQWTAEHQVVLNQLIESPTEPPILGYPDFDQPFTLYFDTS